LLISNWHQEESGLLWLKGRFCVVDFLVARLPSVGEMGEVLRVLGLSQAHDLIPSLWL